MTDKNFIYNNFDAELVNCIRQDFINYQSLNEDPQFIFPNLHAGLYIVRICLTSEDLYQATGEMYWTNSLNEFSPETSLSFKLASGEFNQFFIHLEKDGPLRIDPISERNRKFAFNISICLVTIVF